MAEGLYANAIRYLCRFILDIYAALTGLNTFYGCHPLTQG